MVDFVNRFPCWGDVKHYSPNSIMTDHNLHGNNIVVDFGVYCQIAKNVEPHNSLAPRTWAAILLGNSDNLSGSHLFLARTLVPLQPGISGWYSLCLYWSLIVSIILVCGNLHFDIH
jgi:hypothetical protein